MPQSKWILYIDVLMWSFIPKGGLVEHLSPDLSDTTKWDQYHRNDCYKLGHTRGANVIKKFVRDLQIFIESDSACPW